MGLKTIVFLLLISLPMGVFAQTNLAYPRKTVHGKSFYVYTVNPGEGFYAISLHFNTSQEEILRYNEIAKSGLKAGMELLIPVNPEFADIQEKNSFTHTVQPGETLYAIASLYHTSVAELERLNPDSKNGLKVGFLLTVPQKTNGSIPGDYLFHTIAPKETLFSVANRYNTTIEKIIEENPGLQANSFTIGKVIRILPQEASQNLAAEKKKEQPAQIETFLYKVKRKETLFSISKQFGVSVEEIIASNPGLGKIKTNSEIRIPKVRKNPVAVLTLPEITIDSAKLIRDTFQKIKSVPKEGVLKVALMLPFHLNKPLDTKSALYLEFYEGFLLAVDSLQQTGASISVRVYDTENSEERIRKFLKEEALQKTDLIIAPDNDAQIKLLADFALKNDILLVNTFSLKNDEVSQNPNVFQTNLPHPYLYAEATQAFARQFNDRKVIFLNNEEGESSSKEEFIQTLKDELRKSKIPFETTTPLQLSLEKGDEIANSALFGVVFVPTAGDYAAVSKLLPLLKIYKDAHPDLKLSLFGYPEWQTYTSDFIDLFYLLDTHLFTRFYANPTDPATQRFYRLYKEWFSKGLMPANPHYGMLGYDTGLFFLSALAKEGKGFVNKIEKQPSHSLQTDFDFQRMSNWSGFINKGFYFVVFQPDYTIDKLKLR